VARGALITIEGVDGAGKSTLADALAVNLRRTGLAVEVLREPGGVELAERIRELLRDPASAPSARAEALLYAAARAQLTSAKLEPLLAAGTHVLLDRFVDSSLAYQGVARGLGVQEVRRLNEFATAGLQPDRTLYLRVSPATGRARQGARAADPDRMEREDREFFARVTQGYEQLAREDPERIRTIDADKEGAQVLEDSFHQIADLFERACGSGAHQAL
jgi:dTMP kinase